MSLLPLTKASEIESAYRRLRQRVTRGCRKMARMVSWRGGRREVSVHWKEDVGMWSVFDRTKDKKRYLCFFGLEDPKDKYKLTIVCEVNPPRRSYNRRTAGVFVRDHGGNIHIAHSGRLGGGLVGISKSKFRDFYRGDLKTVVWPDGKESRVIVLGRVDRRHVRDKIADFVHVVHRFKSALKKTRR